MRVGDSHAFGAVVDDLFGLDGSVVFFLLLDIDASVSKHSSGEIPTPHPRGGKEATEPRDSVQNYIHRSTSMSEMLECHNEHRFLISMNCNDTL